MIFEKVLLDGVVTPIPMQHSLSETKKNTPKHFPRMIKENILPEGL